MAVLGSVGDTFIASVAPLFMLSLGSTPFYIGLLTTTEHVQKIARIIGIRLVVHTGKARLMAGSRALAILPVLGLCHLAWQGTIGTTPVVVSLLLFAGREFIRQAGNTVWWAMIQDNTAGDAFGAFMARLRIRQRAASLVVPLIVGWYLGTSPSPGRFGWPFAAGILVSLLSVWWALGIKEGPLAEQEEGAFGQLRSAIRTPAVAWLSIFMATYQLIYSATGSMWVVALRNQGVGAMAFVWMGSIAALGQMISLTWWGRLVDAYGPRSTLSTTLLLKAGLGLTWLFLPTEFTILHVWSALFYLAWGILDSGQNMGRTQAMMDAVTEENQVAGFNAIMYAGSLGGIVGGVGGGWVFGLVSESTITWSGYPISLVYLAGIQAATFVVYLLSRKLAGYTDQTSTRDAVRSGMPPKAEGEPPA